MASELRVNSSTNRSGLGTITYTDSGPIVSGVGTFTNGLTVDGTQTTVKSLKLTGDNYNANWFKTTNKLRFNDNSKATFGTSDDLSIFHNASDSVITHGAGGTGNLKILSGGAQSIECIKAGAVNIAHNGSTKLATTAQGIDVTGHSELDNVNIVGVTTHNGTTNLYGNGGASVVWGNTGYTGHLSFDGSSNAVIRAASGKALIFQTNHVNERFRITSDGKVGINQDTPTCQLQIDSGSSGAGTVTHLELNHKGNDTNDAVKLNFARAGGDIGSIVLEKVASNNTTDFIFNTRSFNTVSESMRITGAGYVNIGTGTAEQQLTVQNSAQHSLIRVISKNDSDTGVDFGDTDDSDIGRIRYSNNGDYMTFRVNNINAVRFDSNGRVQIGGGNSPSQVGDGSLIVYSTDRLHPAIKPAGMSNNYANGWTLLGDNYQADESQINLGLSYSSSGLVLSRGVKVSGSQDDVYLSSQDSYATRPCAIKMDYLGAFNFLTTETNATVATDSAVSLTNVFTIDRVGRIYQRVSGRNMHFGAGNQLEIGVSSGGDPVINAAGGDIQIKDAGNNICIVRSDGFEMRQDIYFGTAGKGIVLGNTSNVDANTLDDYEEGSWTPALQNGSGSFHVHSAVYTKIGRQVGIQFYLTLSNAGSNTNQVQITGLPFPVRAGGWTASKVSTGYNNSGIHCRAEQSTSRIDIKGPADGAVTFANINGTWILSSFIYFTDS